MQNPNSIRNRGLAGMMLVISFLCVFPDAASASLGNKPKEQSRFVHRRTESKSSANSEPRRLKFFEKLFGERKEKNRALAGLRQSLREVRTTAYTHEEADHQPYGRSTAIGTTLRCSRDYTSAAADWSRFPLGTKFQIVGEPTVYVIDDCGGALYGTNTIDIYRPNLASMHAWGTRHVQIKILERAAKRSS